MAFQPCLHFWGFVRPVVVQHQMEFPVRWELSVQPTQELQEFLMAVSAMTLPDHFAIQYLSAANSVVTPLRL